jgi:hypothetical protein
MTSAVHTETRIDVPRIGVDPAEISGFWYARFCGLYETGIDSFEEKG